MPQPFNPQPPVSHADTSIQLGVTESDQKILFALQTIRQAPGTVYSRELVTHLDIAALHQPVTFDHDQCVIESLNGWFSEELVLVDPTSTMSIPGMCELVTNPKFRIFLDLLLAHTIQSSLLLHPKTIDFAVANNRATMQAVHPPLLMPGVPTDSSRRLWANKIVQSYARIGADSGVQYPVCLPSEISAQSRHDAVTDTVNIDISHAYVEDFNAQQILDDLGVPAARVRLNAINTVFGGERTDFGSVEYVLFDAQRSIFTTPQVNFSDSIFSCQPAEDAHEAGVVNLRDAHFTRAGQHISFNGSKLMPGCIGISFEDAHAVEARVTFNHAGLQDARIDFYQAEFLGQSRVEFIESDLRETALRFTDAVFGYPVSPEQPMNPSTIVLYRVQASGRLDFDCRLLGSLLIENSVISGSSRFAPLQRLSLWGSIFADAPVSIDPTAAPARRVELSQRKMWFLDAIEFQRAKQREALATEFAMLKEVFNTMGEYELEDEAFVRHMRHKPQTLTGRIAYQVLDTIGRFGTSIRRTALWLVIIWLLWVAVNMLCLVLFPDGFDILYTTGSVWTDAATYAATNLIQSSAGVVPVSTGMISLGVIQSMSGWFFLGYFFSAFVRRTLR